MGTESKIAFAKRLLVSDRERLIKEEGWPDCEWTFEEFKEDGTISKYISDCFTFKVYEK